MRVAILGSGPAGLVAAAAIETQLDAETVIYALGPKSPLYGAQYLHAPIPGFTKGAPIDVKYILEGEALIYRSKVYGYADVKTSVETLDEDHQAWDIRQTYDALWEEYNYLIEPTLVDWQTVNILNNNFDLIISTIPAPRICRRKDGSHQFKSTDIIAAGSAPDIGITLEDSWDIYCKEGEVICSGRMEDPWYRMSRIFGYITIEFPMAMRHFGPKTAGIVRKPLSHDCNCWEGSNIIQVGRYGAWKKGVLVHEVYDEVTQLCQTL